jgi:hypothetical protein
MTAPTTAPPAPTAAAGPHSDRAVRLLAAIRVALVAALTVLVLAIAALAYVVSFEAIRAFAIETAAFPPELAWSAPLLVDSFTTAAKPGHPVALPARGRLARPLVCLDVGQCRHRRLGRPERRPRPRPAGCPALRRPAPGGAAGGAGAADERGPHRPAAHQPHPTSTPARPGRPWRRARPHASSNGYRTQPRSRPPRLRAAPTQSSTARPHRMCGPRCGRWSPANAPAAPP